MARKTKEETENTYAMLLEAAEQMFFDKGVAHTTLADIASAAGMTRGAIYWHFKDKGALLHALFEQATLPMENMLAEATAHTATDPLGALHRMCAQSLATLAGSPRQQRIFNILFHKCEKMGEVADVLQHELACRDECMTKFDDILRQAIAVGQLPADTDVFLSRQTLHNFIMGTMREWLLEPDSYSLVHAAPAMVDMVFAGLRTCPPRVKPG